MNKSFKLTNREVRKLIIKQQLTIQRLQLVESVAPIKQTTARLIGLFKPDEQNTAQKGRFLIVASLGLLIATLSKRQSLIGRVARYIVLKHPGMLYKLTK